MSRLIAEQPSRSRSKRFAIFLLRVEFLGVYEKIFEDIDGHSRASTYGEGWRLG